MESKLKKEKILVSACIIGIACRYDGKSKKYKVLPELLKKAICIPVCPEILAGFGIPRERVEIKGGNGEDVLFGKAAIFTEQGIDVTDRVLKAARAILEFCREAKIKKAVLKDKSPSCGKNFIYDGSFGGKLIEGKGVLAAVLEQAGIEVFSETEVFKAVQG